MQLPTLGDIFQESKFLSDFESVHGLREGDVSRGLLSTSHGKENGLLLVLDSNQMSDTNHFLTSMSHAPGAHTELRRGEAVNSFPFVLGAAGSVPDAVRNPEVFVNTEPKLQKREKRFKVHHIGVTATRTQSDEELISLVKFMGTVQFDKLRMLTLHRASIRGNVALSTRLPVLSYSSLTPARTVSLSAGCLRPSASAVAAYLGTIPWVPKKRTRPGSAAQ